MQNIIKDITSSQKDLRLSIEVTDAYKVENHMVMVEVPTVVQIDEFLSYFKLY